MEILSSSRKGYSADAKAERLLLPLLYLLRLVFKGQMQTPLWLKYLNFLQPAYAAAYLLLLFLFYHMKMEKCYLL